jgi:tagatose-1,6-bisphosphate aldolase
VFEQGNTSEKIPMLETSSFIVDTSCDEELTKKVFGDLNRDILEPPRDGKIIVLYDSDDDEEAQEEKAAEIESTATPASADDAPAEARIDNSNDQRPNQEVDGSNNSGRSTSDP